MTQLHLMLVYKIFGNESSIGPISRQFNSILVIWQLGDLILVTLLAEKSEERLGDKVA